MTLQEQLTADRADQDRRIADKRRMREELRYQQSDLLRAFHALADLAHMEAHWSRDDLIQLVDLALAEAAARTADDAAP